MTQQPWPSLAREEHASIAAFADLITDLVDAGAPPELILRANKAAADEVRHARIALKVTEGMAQEKPSPAPGMIERWARRKHLQRMALESYFDGCLNEGLAAARMAERNEREPDPEKKALVASVVSDELEHAELAWSVVEWCLRELEASAAGAGGKFRDVLLRGLARRETNDALERQVLLGCEERLREWAP